MYNLLLRESFEVRPVHGRREDRGSLCNIADLKIAAWQRLDSARAPVYIILTYDFSRKFCFLHTFIATSPFCIVPAGALAARPARCVRATRRDATRRRVLSPEENVCAAPCVRARGDAKKPAAAENGEEARSLGTHPPVSRTFYTDKLDSSAHDRRAE